MVIAVEQFASLSNLTVAAAMDPRGWQHVVDELGKCMGSQFCTQLIGYDRQSKAAPIAYSSGYDPHVMDIYKQNYADKNPYAAGFEHCREGHAISCHELCRPESLRKTSFYSDILRPHEDIHCGGGTLLVRDENRMFLIGGNIRAKDQERYEKDWMELCVRLAPVMRQSLEINRMIAGLSFEKWATERHQLGTGTAVIVVDPAMSIQFACSTGQKLLAHGGIVGATQDSKLHVSSEKVQGELIHLAGLHEKRHQTVFRSFRMNDTAGRRWLCRVIGVRLGELDQTPFGSFLTKTPSGLLLAIKPDMPEQLFRKMVQQLTGLSAAETEIAVSLSDGLTLSQIAQTRNASIHTVRNQLKSALSKSDCNRQTQLVQKVEQLRGQVLI
ncbi:MAG: helix-turn-helix transcriptional regulator [Roseibium sp.]